MICKDCLWYDKPCYNRALGCCGFNGEDTDEKTPACYFYEGVKNGEEEENKS